MATEVRAVVRAGGQASTIQPLKRVAGVLVSALLASAIFGASLVFISSTLPTLLGFKTMVVTSGSMGPTIKAGDVALIRKLAAPAIVRAGDVITFTAFASQGMTTHRVIAVKEIAGDTYYQTQGDANTSPDPNLTSAGAVYGKVARTLPKVGYLLYFAATAWGRVLLILLPMVILMVCEVRALPRLRKSPQPKTGHPAPDEAGSYEAARPT